MRVSTILKWVTGGLEALLGIPILGGTLIIGLAWTPLIVMLILHIVTLVFSVRENEKKHGSILGIVTSCVAWIPFVGMTMHIITAIILMIDAYNARKAA
jgi:predicted branched-subunit amino acid permease